MIILAAAVILSLSSSGIIGRANNAVDKTNLAQVQTLAQTIWAEIYLENLEGANLDYETEVPKRLGDQKIDTTKYNINADASGVTVTLKGSGEETPKLNEYGFYYNVIYATTWEDGTISEYVFYDDGTIIVFNGRYIQFGEICEYSQAQAINEDGYVCKFSPDGTSCVMESPYEDEPDITLTATGVEHGVYYGYNYVADTGLGVCFAENGIVKFFSYEEDGELYEDYVYIIKEEAKGHIISTPFDEFEVAVNGNKLYMEDTVFVRGEKVEKGNYKIASGLYNPGAIAINEAFGVDVSDGLITSWEELLQDGVIHVENGTVYTNCDINSWNNSSDSALYGDLVLPSTGITTIGEEAFRFCNGITNVTIPDSVTSIHYAAFDNCQSLTWITIPNSVTTIGEWSFAHCYELTRAIISDSVTTIGENTFYNCSKLTSVTIPNSVASIGTCAFSDCRSLTSVTIPNSVTTIKNFAFENCDKLHSIVFRGTVEQWNNINKQMEWNEACSEIKVICSDGTVIVPENEDYTEE